MTNCHRAEATAASDDRAHGTCPSRRVHGDRRRNLGSMSAIRNGKRCGCAIPDSAFRPIFLGLAEAFGHAPRAISGVFEMSPCSRPENRLRIDSPLVP